MSNDHATADDILKKLMAANWESCDQPEDGDKTPSSNSDLGDSGSASDLDDGDAYGIGKIEGFIKVLEEEQGSLDRDSDDEGGGFTTTGTTTQHMLSKVDSIETASLGADDVPNGDAEQVVLKKRHQCANPPCGFSRSDPGKPNRAGKAGLCMWCDPEMLTAAVWPGNIQQSLAAFKTKNSAVYDLACEKLPADFDTGLQQRCANASCVFSRSRPGQPSWADKGRSCLWCDPEKLAAEVLSNTARRRVKQSLAEFKSKNAEVYDLACAKLPADFDMELDHWCVITSCVFSQTAPGVRHDPTVTACVRGATKVDCVTRSSPWRAAAIS